MAAVMMQNVTYATCCFIKLMHESVVEFMKLKYLKLNETGVPRNDIKLMMIQDEETIKETRKVLVALMLKKYPKGFNHLVKFDNWKGMLLYIEENQGENNAQEN
jgi:hypothetical protein